MSRGARWAVTPCERGLPALTLRVEKKRGGVHIVVEPSLYTLQGLDYSYLYNEDTIWKLERAEAAVCCPR